MSLSSLRVLVLLPTLCLLLSACVNHTVKSTSVIDVRTPDRALSEQQLLDVGVVIFDPGLDDASETEDPSFAAVRRAEARYMPNILREAIESSLAWGAVRVIPDDQQAMDLVVSGTILNSDGEQLKISILARDATGKVWLNNKKYQSRASKYSYQKTTRARVDPFQSIYNQIANDLLSKQQDLKLEQLARIQLVNELRFARSFSPQAFEGHISSDKRGRYTIQRLPAENDPMLERVRKIRQRDYIFVDTLQSYYEAFNGQMAGPYQEWRKLSYEETIALRELEAESRRALIAGAALLVAGIAAAGSNDGSSRAAANVGILGGGALLKAGYQKRQETEIHVQALEELGLSLESEIAPQVIEVEDRTITLTGSVQDQYDQWRELLRQIYQAEIGDIAPVEQGGET